jgi:hypothetical protein
MKAILLAESSIYFIFSLGSLPSRDVYRCESGRYHTFPFFLRYFYHFTFPGFPFVFKKYLPLIKASMRPKEFSCHVLYILNASTIFFETTSLFLRKIYPFYSYFCYTLNCYFSMSVVFGFFIVLFQSLACVYFMCFLYF